MKEKDAGNRQRYDPVSKRMITTHPEIPTISKVSLSISQPVFVGVGVDGVFKSDYTVTFQGYTGCLNYGNDVTCSIYDQTGAQTATVTAKITNGINTLVLNGQYKPLQRYVYYASIQYGLSRFNSSPTQLSPRLPLISNGSLAVSDAVLNEVSTHGGLFSFDDAFDWRGKFRVNFVSYDSSNLTATVKVWNVTDPQNLYEVASWSSPPLSYGVNNTTVDVERFIRIPSGSGRTSIPYNSTQSYSTEITYDNSPYQLPITVLPTPKLIRDVTITFGESYWSGGALYTSYTLSYYFADGTLSSYITSVNGQRSVFEARPRLDLVRLNSDGTSTTIDSFVDVNPENNLNAVGTYTNSRQLVLTSPLPASYYGVVNYDDSTFTATESYSGNTTTLLSPEFSSSPEIVSFSSPFDDVNGRFANFNVRFVYNPRNGLPPEDEDPEILQGYIISASGSFDPFDYENEINPVVGTNNLALLYPVVSGEYYSFSIRRANGTFSSSVLVAAPTFDDFNFTSVSPSDGVVRLTYDENGNITRESYNITLTWHNGLLPLSTQVTISTVGLLDTNGNAVNTTIDVTGTTITFQIDPVIQASSNFVESTLAQSIINSGGFSPFQFKITDNTGRVSALSIPFRSG